jgi:hypothetical protein
MAFQIVYSSIYIVRSYDVTHKLIMWLLHIDHIEVVFEFHIANVLGLLTVYVFGHSHPLNYNFGEIQVHLTYPTYHCYHTRD